MHTTIYRQRQKGFASWVVVAFGLVGTLTALSAVLAATSTSTRSVSINSIAKQVAMQANMIRNQIMTCAIGDPATGRTGDNGTGLNVAFPYTGSAAGIKSGGSPVGTGGAVDALYCARTASGALWVTGASDRNLWSGVGGVFLPPAPSGFSAWQFASTANVVKISISYSGVNPDLGAAVALAAAKFSTAEVSTATANTLTVCLVINAGTCS